MTRAADLAKLIAGGGSITVADNSENLKLITTDADASVGPTLRMDRQSASAADSDLLGKINFVGHNDAGTPEDIGYAGITAIISDASDGTEDGKLAINTMVAGTERSRIFVDAGETVLNEDSIDLDFRVEGNGLTHALFVDGETDNVMIGTSVAGRADEGADRLTIADAAHSGMTIRSGTGSYGSINFSDSEGGAGEYAGQIWYGHGGLGDKLVFASLGLNRVTVTADVSIEDGNLKVASGHGIDFSATSDVSGMASELLDNYEEGSFTPTFGGSGGNQTVSYGTQLGTYVLVGKMAYVNVSVIASGTPSGGGGDLVIFGIPFTAKAGVQQAGSIAFANNMSFGSDITDGGCNIEGNVAYLNINAQQYSGTSSMGRVPHSGIHNSAPRIVCSIVYEVA
tara:strand:+ start:830 stop:2023 length:1194 start_codon:yes stop_codon:yes gene_type:complete